MIRALALTGPTASGKTALSLAVAEELSAEIISCDSMQIYRGMNIGTAKATEEERTRVPHHLIDFLSPLESYSAERYREDAVRCALDITGRGKVPLFVGGTGLYIDTVIRGVSNSSPESDPEYRDAILASLKTEEDIHALWERLRSVDLESAEKIHENNVKRVIRALEIYDKTGKSKTELDRATRNSVSDVKVGMITLDFHNRETLYERVDLRVEQMMSEGLLAEAESLYREGLLLGQTAGAAIGYKELIGYIEGRTSLSESVGQIKLATRRYAKRQLTWFRHNTDAKRLYADFDDGRLKSKTALIDEAISLAKELLN